jgi:hypothetical protein
MTCAICLEQMAMDKATTLRVRAAEYEMTDCVGCSHSFHKTCIEALEASTEPPYKCPLCRRKYRHMRRDDLVIAFALMCGTHRRGAVTRALRRQIEDNMYGSYTFASTDGEMAYRIKIQPYP